MYNFITDLLAFEEKYGCFSNFTRVNKLRFQELSGVEHSLKNKYQQLMNYEMIPECQSCHNEAVDVN